MKRIISLCLLVIMIVAVALTAPAASADGQLTVTANGANPRSYSVGDEIVFFVGLDAGDVEVLNGQGEVTYDKACLELVEYMAEYRDELSMEAYTFPFKIMTSNTALNTETPGLIRYNFSRARGVGKFTSTDQHYLRFHFLVKAGGSCDIATTIQYMCDTTEAYIFYKSELAEGRQAVYAAKTMPATATVGDVNADERVDLRDAVTLDRYLDGWEGYNARIPEKDVADLDQNGEVNGDDALILDRYVSGWKGYGDYIIEITR